MRRELDSARFGLGLGSAWALLYLICILLIVIIGPQSIAYLVSILFHGLDMSALVSRQVTLGYAILGIIEVFIFGWLMGALTAVIYNWSLPRKE